MDRRQRKPKRSELQGLVDELSRELDRLTDENARLRQALAAPRFPKNMKVGSIAEAALEANGFFQDAQRAADDYLREIKRLHDELALRNREAQELARSRGMGEGPLQARARAEAEAQVLIRDAQAQANRIISVAKSQAQSIQADALRQAAQEEARPVSGQVRGRHSAPPRATAIQPERPREGAGRTPRHGSMPARGERNVAGQGPLHLGTAAGQTGL